MEEESKERINELREEVISTVQLNEKDQAAFDEIVQAYDRVSREYIEYLKNLAEPFPEIFHKHGLDSWFVELHLTNTLLTIGVADQPGRVEQLPLYTAVITELSKRVKALFIQLAQQVPERLAPAQGGES